MPRPARSSARFAVEHLEAREVPAVFTVTSLLDDGGVGTLRWAVDQANTTAGEDRIEFAPAVAGNTITLAQGQLVLADPSTTTIDGGTAGVAIDGGGASRLFRVNPGAASVLKGLTLANGSVSGSGGGINNSGTLTVSDSVVQNNSGNNRGGGIFNDGTLVVTASTITNNHTSGGGGGIFNAGTATVSSSTIGTNSAGTRGGGIFSEGSLTVTASILDSNSTLRGGGLFNSSAGTMTVNACTISRNAAEATLGGTLGDGGGIFNSGVLAVAFSNIGHNYAVSGGGINNSGSGTLAITASTINTNETNGSGGGLYSDGAATVTACTISDNSALGKGDGFGGGLYNGGNLFVAACTVTGNLASTRGGGVYNGGTATLTTSVMTDSVFGALTASSVHNLLVDVGSVGGLTDGVNGNIVVPTVAAVGLDPAGLRDNGGPTQTIALLATSPAVNRGVLVTDPVTGQPLAADQRGVSRDSRPDIGAFEFTAFQPSLVVTTLTDEDDGTSDSRVGSGTSLREAVAYANAHAGIDTITFASGVTGKTIVLTGGQLTLTDSATTTIDGGSAGVTIDGNNATRLFFVNGGASAAINKLTLTNGYALNGGGIYSLGSLAITGSTISENTSSGEGGGIFNNSGPLAVTDSTVSGNTAGHGGGIFNGFGTVTVATSTISRNLSVGAGGIGGGIFSRGRLTVTGSTVSDNTSADLGGGIFNDGGLTVTGSTLSGNSSAHGGGIYNRHDLVVTASTVSGNSADFGGGIYNSLIAKAAISASTVSNNSAQTGDGGGVFSDGTLTIADSLFGKNSADTFGGGVSNTGQMTVTKSTFNGNSAHGGGGIYSSGGLAVTGTTFGGNSAVFGGGIDNRGTLEVEGSTLRDNVAVYAGGGIHNMDYVGTSVIGSSSFIGNSGTYGGGIYSEGALSMTASSLVGNSADIGGGINNYGSLTVANSTVNGNSAIRGGGIQNNGTLTLTASTVSGNSATNSGGGIDNRWRATVANSTLSNNTSGDYGAAISSTGELTVLNSTLSGNTADFGGAGIWNEGELAVLSSTISGNTAVVGSGIYQFPDLGTTTLAGTIVADSVSGVVAAASMNNLLVGGASVGGLSNGVNGNIVVPTVAEAGLDPAGLKDNGGPTQTIALLANSPAIGHGMLSGSPVMESLTSGGSGMPQGSVGLSFAADRRSGTLISDSFVASQGPGVSATESAKSGLVNFNLRVPAGTTVFGLTLDLRGYIATSTGVTGQLRVSVQTPPGGITLISDGSFARDYLGTGRDYLESVHFYFLVPPGVPDGAVIPLAVETSIILIDAGGNPNASSQLTVDSLDFRVGLGPTAASPELVLAGGAAIDQRGRTRNANPDIGAFETTATGITVSATGAVYTGLPYAGASVTVTGLPASQGTVSYAYTNTATSATGSTPPTAAGNYTVTATFTPSVAGYRRSVGSPVAFTITRAIPTVNLTGPANAVYSGTAVAATATVTGVSGTPAATLEGVAPTLTYYAGPTATGTPLASAPVNAGTYTVMAAFAGSANYTPGATTKTFTIAPATVAVGLATDRPVAVPGMAVTFTATVTAANGAPVTGTVTFKDGATVLGTAAVVNGVARLTTDAFQYGTHTVTATFAGGSNYTGPAAPPSVGVSVVPAAVLFDPVTGTNALFVGGTTGGDEIEIKREGNDRYEVEIEGGGCHDEYERTFCGPVGRVVVYAGAGNDEVSFNGNVRVPVWVFGGAGDDDITGAENAPNVLVGGAGNDRLRGGTGRDILIGGAGADELDGKGGDDLMIGGTTAFDLSEPALWGVQLEWTSDRTYEQRVANLRGTGTGPRLNGNTLLVASGSGKTVFDDGTADRFKGGSGRDWFFGRKLGTPRDRFDDLAGNELLDEVS